MDDEKTETIIARYREAVSHHDTREMKRRLWWATKSALERRGLVPDVSDRYYIPETERLRHVLSDRQQRRCSPSQPGSQYLDASNAETAKFIADFFGSDGLPPTLRLGFDAAGTKGAMAKVDDVGSVHKLLYATISRPDSHEASDYLAVGVLEPPHTGARVETFLLDVEASLAQVPGSKPKIYAHTDHGGFKDLKHTSGCPWCGAIAPYHLAPVYNNSGAPLKWSTLTSTSTVTPLPGLWHGTCVQVSSLLLAAGADSGVDRILKQNNISFQTAPLLAGGKYDSVSIKELTRLAENPSILKQLKPCIPKDIADALDSCFDLKKNLSVRTMDDFTAHLDLVTDVLQHHKRFTPGCHILWHIPALVKTLGLEQRDWYEPFIEQGLEHFNQQMILLRRSHNLWAPRALLSWHNASFHRDAGVRSRVRAMLSGSHDPGPVEDDMPGSWRKYFDFLTRRDVWLFDSIDLKSPTSWVVVRDDPDVPGVGLFARIDIPPNVIVAVHEGELQDEQPELCHLTYSIQRPAAAPPPRWRVLRRTDPCHFNACNSSHSEPTASWRSVSINGRKARESSDVIVTAKWVRAGHRITWAYDVIAMSNGKARSLPCRLPSMPSRPVLKIDGV